MPVIAYLSRPQGGDTGQRGREGGARFRRAHNDGASSSCSPPAAGIDTATNIVVRDANRKMLLYGYAAVIVLLCFITFRSWRAVIVALVPLIITSILCEALMVGSASGSRWRPCR
jgi:predicted RND superfamily exporter protein